MQTALIFLYFCNMKREQRGISKTVWIITIAFFALLFVQTVWHLVPMEPLANDWQRVPKPQLSYANFRDCTFQNELNEYLKDQYAFREFLTRLFNQYRYSFYNKSCSDFFVPGKDHWMYYSPGVYDYYGLEAPKFFKSNEELMQFYDELLVKLCELRSILKNEFDIELLTYVGPDKPFIYPEHLPKKKGDTSMLRAASYFSEIAETASFPHINMTPWFKAMADTSSRLLFMPMESHWKYSAVYGYDSLLRLMDGLNDFGIPKLKINGISEQKYIDRQGDEKTINLLFKVKNTTPKYTVDVSVVADSTKHKPKVLFVGDSFFFALAETLPVREIFFYYELWFYNDKVFKGFEAQEYKLSEINKLRSILNVDYVVLYSVGYNWYKEIHPFVNDALQSIKDPKQVEVALMMNQIENNSEWMHSISEEAEKNGISIEKQLEFDAQKYLDHQEK